MVGEIAAITVTVLIAVFIIGGAAWLEHGNSWGKEAKR